MTTKAQELVEEIRKRKAAEAAAAGGTNEDTSALDDLMGDILSGATDPDDTSLDTATPEDDGSEPEVTTEVTDDAFITIVPVPEPTNTMTVEDLPPTPTPTPTPTTTPEPTPSPAATKAKAKPTKQAAPKVTETAAPAVATTEAPLTRSQLRTLAELEAGRKALAKK